MVSHNSNFLLVHRLSNQSIKEETSYNRNSVQGETVNLHQKNPLLLLGHTSVDTCTHFGPIYPSLVVACTVEARRTVNQKVGEPGLSCRVVSLDKKLTPPCLSSSRCRKIH